MTVQSHTTTSMNPMFILLARLFVKPPDVVLKKLESVFVQLRRHQRARRMPSSLLAGRHGL